MLPIPPFTALVTSAGVTALNRLLGREAWAAQRLDRHTGKTVRFVLGRTSVSLTICAGGTVQAADSAIVPDVVLTLPSNQTGQLFDLLRHKDPEQIVDALHIQGDAGLANVVAELARHLRWDIEHDLARVLGDVPAMRLISGGQALVQGLSRAGQRLAGNVGEYLTEEEPVLLGRHSLLAWQGSLAQARLALDTLEQRVSALERQRPIQGGRA